MPGSSTEDLSAVRQAQMATRVFRKLVGRDPSPNEIAALRDASLAQMVDTVLAHPDFGRDGFFGFQRDRLLLHRDGDEGWLKASLNDYCALRLEMQEVARADATGPGYYEILRYRDRWIPLTASSMAMPPACLMTKTGPLREAVNAAANNEFGGEFGDGEFGDGEFEDGEFEDGEPSAPARQMTEAETCAQSLWWRDDIRAILDELDSRFDDTPFILTEPGRQLLVDQLKQNNFGRYSFDENEPELPQAEISVLTDADGRPLLQTFDGEPSDRCVTADAYGRPLSVEDDKLVVYVKVHVPADLEGVHASMYWLSRHPSTKKNRDLHRARLVYFSYMCTEISPAMAAVGGGAPVQIPELEPYFDPEDEHTRTSANCYNCHTQVQPIANYFGELSKGSPYSAVTVGEDGEFAWSSFYSSEERFRRPGGLWRGDSFHPAGAGKFGMEGLAELLSGLDAAHDCIVRNAWSSLVGSGYPLTEEERAAAVAAFKGSDGAFRFGRLLRHLAVDNARGRAFFEGGEAALAAVQPGESADCRDVASVPPGDLDAPETLLEGACAGCHSGNTSRGFFERTADGSTVWNPERLVGPGQRYGHAAELYDRLYCKVWSDSMPIGGWRGGDAAAQKKKALCYFGGKRNEAARASDDPAIRAIDSRPCDGQVPPPSGEPHPIGPTP